MITQELIGRISLNISFVLYLVIYLPQIRHNQKPEHLIQLSTTLHFILITSFGLDLAYSVLKPLPWQYQTVSVVALSLLAIQHIQLIKLSYQRKNFKLFNLLTGAGCVFLSLLLWFFQYPKANATLLIILSIGYVSRLGFLVYMLPQIVQNYRLKTADALSTTFLNLSLCLSTLDLISAWCLHWGWPNQIGTPITIFLTLILRLQQSHYQLATPRNTKHIAVGIASE